MAITNSTGGLKQTISFEHLICSARLTGEIHKPLILFLVLNIFLSMTAFLGNTLILKALRKETSLHPPSKLLLCCLATTDLCVGLISQPLVVATWMSIRYENWNLCRYTYTSCFIASHTLSSVSLMTMTSISVDRLLALLLGLRYRQIVTLKRTLAILAVFWVISTVAATSYLVNHLITFWHGYIGIPLCLVTSIAAYIKIFLKLRHHQTQVQDRVQQEQPSQTVPLNIARYRKAVASALWVQLALVACYLPYNIVGALIGDNNLSSSLYLAWLFTITLLYLNSTLTPFLYCWRIREVKQAVKETIREVVCSSSG